MSDYDPAQDSREGYEVGIAAIRAQKIAGGEIVPWVRREVVGDCTLYLADSLELLPALGSVDLVLTDPPYESHMHSAKRVQKSYGAIRRIRTDGHANPPPVDFASIDGIRERAAVSAVAASAGWALIFCTPEGVAPWRDVLEAAGARYKRACVWVKPDSAPQFNGQGPAMGAEMFVSAWCGRGFSRWNGGGRRNIWTYPCQPPDRHGEHPTEKPAALLADLISLFSDPEALVLDPFMGSGSTLVACVRTGRRGIGIEIDPRYFDIACERVTEAYRSPDLFIEHAKKEKAETVDLFGSDAA